MPASHRVARSRDIDHLPSKNSIEVCGALDWSVRPTGSKLFAMIARPALAPPISFRDELGHTVRLVDPRGGPVVVALASMPLAHDAAAVAGELRAELRGLGATLIVGDPGGYWRMRPDDAVDVLDQAVDDRFAQFGLGSRGQPAPWLAVLVIDAAGAIRFRHVERDRRDASPVAIVLDALRASGRALRAGRAAPLLPITRRELIIGSMVTAFGVALASACRPTPAPQAPPGKPRDAGMLEVTLRVNGRPRSLTVEPRVTLLDALRERLALTGTKKGCDHGQCGACTVMVDGRATLSCLTLAVMHDGAQITTIEGLATGDALHPMQAAFLAHDAYQCGYCTPGQIISAVALVADRRATSDDEVREQMSGNLCRCGAYPNIVAAVQSVRGQSRKD